MDLSAMNNLVKQAQAMKDKIAKVQDELSRKTVTATSGGGMVAATANGAGELVALKVEKEIINPDDPEMLSDLILAAANQAIKDAQKLMAEEMSKITGGLNLKDLF